MDGFTSEAVFMSADRAHEEVDMVLVYTPARAVRCLTVETVGFLALRCRQAPGQVLLVNLRGCYLQ